MLAAITPQFWVQNYRIRIFMHMSTVVFKMFGNICGYANVHILSVM